MKLETRNGLRVFYAPLPDNGEDEVDNPHACIYENVPCLACALIEAMGGEDNRIEALELAEKVAVAAASWPPEDDNT